MQDAFYMLLGSFIAGFAVEGLLIPNNFIDGGATGISLLIHELTHYDLWIILIVVNIPFMWFGIYVLSKNFIVRTLISIILFGLFASFVPYPVITSDKLLGAVFGGFLVGLGIGINMRAGSSMDGTEVLALYTLKRSNFTISEIILAINAIIFAVAALHFGIQNALYSMLTYIVASKTIDYVVEGIEQCTGVTIISAHSERIKEMLVNEMGAGITVYKGERGFLPGKYDVHIETDIIFTVVTRLELRRVTKLVHEEDPNAFVFASMIKEAAGGVLKRKPTH